MQKEFKNLLSAIGKWVKANKGEVDFIGSFISFDKDKIKKGEKDVLKDSILVGYGDKKGLEIMLEELQDSLKREKKDFINW